MARRCELLSEDLARPAKELPLKTIKTLGYLLHSHLHTSGNWETVAEDLGYCYEAIKQFSTNANVRQDCTPGEIMLRDWIGRGNGRTLFVLRNALCSSDRHDCVELLDQEINDKVLHMNLQVCFADQNGTNVNYQLIRTKTSASLRDSLQNILDGPIRNYQLADSGISWDSTLAREYKGQELKIYRLNPLGCQEQDPTIDSSSQSVDNNLSVPGLLTLTNELDRSIFREPPTSFCRNLNIPLPSEKQNNVSSMEPTQHGHSHVCQTGKKVSPKVITKIGTIYDDQDLTRQDITRVKQRQKTIKVNTSIFSETKNSETFRKGTNHIDKSSFNVAQDLRVDPSDTDSLTAQKEVVECVNNARRVNLQNILCAHSSDSSIDSVTKKKEILMSNRNPVKLVDYTPSTSGSDIEKPFFPDHFIANDFKENERDGLDVDRAEDLAEYSYAPYSRGFESHTDEEKYMFAFESPNDNSSTETDDHLMKRNNDISFVNTNLMIVEQYQGCWSDNCAATKNNNTINCEKSTCDSFPSEMDCQSLVGMQSSEEENTHKNPGISDETSYCTPQFGLDLEGIEADDSSYQKKSETGNIQTLFGKNTDVEIADLVDDRAIHVVNDHDDGHVIDIADLVDDSAIHIVNDHDRLDNNISEPMHDSAVCGVDDGKYNFNDLAADNAVSVVDKDCTVNKFMEHSAMHVAELDSVNTIDDLADESAIQVASVAKSERSKLIDIYAFSVIPGVNEAQKRAYNSRPKPEKIKGAYRYESLQRFMSCPNDIDYEAPANQIGFQKIFETMEIPTIADAFTPVQEQLNLKEFLKGTGEQRSQNGRTSPTNVPVTVHSLDRPRRQKTEIQLESIPNRRSCTDVIRMKGNDNARTILSQGNINKPEDRPLPSTPSADFDFHTQSPSPPLLPPKVPRLSPHPYKLISGGKNSRSKLDHLIANDRLFVHYNTCLQGYLGWNPRETEDMVEKTLQSVIRGDGYYLLWYARSRKRLALSISHLGKIIHYEVRTKVNNGQLFYYIFPDTVFPDVRLLLQFHQSHGLRPQTEQEKPETGFIANQNQRDSQSCARYSHVFMKCPVLVEYGARQACSV